MCMIDQGSSGPKSQASSHYKSAAEAAHVAFGHTELTGDGASGFLGGGGPSGDDPALGQPLNGGRTAQR
jgi:hypothetical protein